MPWQVGVMGFQSLKSKPQRASCQFSAVKPIFDTLGSCENCDSVTGETEDVALRHAAGALTKKLRATIGGTAQRGR